QPVLAHEDRQDQVLLGDLARQEIERLEAQADLGQVDAGDAVLLAQGLQRRQIGDGPVSSQPGCKAAAFLLGESALQLIWGERTLPKQDLSDLLPVGHPVDYPPKGSS